MADYPRSFQEFQARFRTEDDCASYLFETRWPEGFRCPGCGGYKGWRLKTRAHLWECARCGRQTSITAGTIMHKSKLPLTTWFWACFLMATHSNGISALQLMRQVGIRSYKTAWMLCAKIRCAMVNPVRDQLSGEVEVDETFVPFRPKSQHNASPSYGRSTDDRIPVIGAVEVEGYLATSGGKQVFRSAAKRVRLRVMSGTTKSDIQPFVRANVAPGSHLTTDKWVGYDGLDGYTRKAVNQKIAEAHVLMPHIHRVFALLKRWGLGVYHGLRQKHMQRYLDEFAFRFNRRRGRHSAFRTIMGIGMNIDPRPYKQLIAA